MSKTVWAGKFLTVQTEGTWEFAARQGEIAAAVIVAIDEGDVILVEQFRVPLGRACLELPAGLVGDETAGESVAVAAGRELEEETGYRADAIEDLGVFYSSPGMTSECFTLVRATGLTKVGDGGGMVTRISPCTGCRWRTCRGSWRRSARLGWRSIPRCC